MTIKGVFPVGVVLALFLCGDAAESQDVARTTPPSVEKERSGVEPEAAPPALPVTTTGDPRGGLSLRQALHETLLYNPELLAFSFELRAIEARRLQAGLLPNPELSAELENFGGTGSTRGVQSSEATIQLSQLIELGGKRANRLRLAGLERDVAGFDYEAKRLEIFTDTTKAFVEALAAQERLALTTELLRLAERVLETVSERVKAGKVSPVEATRARIAVSTARLHIRQARSAYEAARKRLASFWGSTAPRFERLSGSLETTVSMPSEEQLATMMQKNPDIARWAVEMDARRAQVAVEQSQRIPDVTVSGGVRYIHETEDPAFVVGFSVPLMLFDRNQGGIREARARLEQAEYERRAAEVRVGTALSEAYQNLVNAANEVEVLQQDVLPATHETFQATQEGYRQGKFGFLEVLDAQRTLFETRGQFLETLTAYHKAVADIERLIGEGLPAAPPGDGEKR
jgi:cobalt-zinc-cadmium efflux system outer membrane protein